jgi:hypothetical protein
MPDGFDPHTELARIYNLRDLMTGCRGFVPSVLRVIEDGLNDPDITIRMQAANMAMDRGFGKPRQTVTISEPTDNVHGRKVQIHLPDNGREPMPMGPVIDADQ